MPLPKTLQETPPKAARFCLDTERFLFRTLAKGERRIFQNTHIILGFSGGADSTALLLALHYLAHRNHWRITAAHLDHGLRPKSGEDAAHARRFCKKLGVEYQERALCVRALAKERGLGLEDAGRQARYAFFTELRNSLGAQWVFLAHQLNDLAEDVLMRLTRGAAWPGLGGMEGIDDEKSGGRNICRPLLLTPRDCILSFLDEIGADWIDDASNTDPAFFRNRVRRDILPLFLRENPNFLESVATLWRLARIDQEHRTEEMQKSLLALKATTAPGDPNSRLLPTHILTAAPAPLRLELYKTFLNEMGAGQPLAKTLLALDDAWSERRFGTEFRFPGDKAAVPTVEGIYFQTVLRRR